MHTLDDLHAGRLAGAHHVRLVNLGLTGFPAQLFDLADTLEILDLSGNALTALPDDLHRLHRLRILFCSDNPFTSLPPALGRCPALEMVGFKACAIEQVSDDSLPPQLRWLILTGNHIRQLPAALGQRPRLQKLMLSCNRLTRLPDLSGCSRLELLRLAGNGFTAVPDTVHSLPSLAWLAMAGNPLTAHSERTVLEAAATTALAQEVLNLGPLLGEGASGRIHLAHHRDTGQALALKVFRAARTSDGTPQSELAAGLAAGKHPHLMTPLAAVGGRPQQPLATVFPLLSDTYRPLAGPPDFDSCTRDIYPPHCHFHPAQADQLVRAVETAIAHLHSRAIVHGDLYAHNVLWNPDTGHALLSDFGAAMLGTHLPSATLTALQAIERRALDHLVQEIRSRTRPAVQCAD